MEDSITGTLIAEPNGRIIKSSGDLQNNQTAIVNSAIKMLEGTNNLIKNGDNTFHKLNDKKQPLRDAIQQSKALLTNQITLSEGIKKYPQCVDEFKIRLVQKQIKSIDKIQNQFKKIDTLYISNNCIQSLDGIEQFTFLQHLSISNNNIKDIGMIKNLRNIDTLESLNMQGNPVSKHPIYRQLVLSTLPNLQQLDGKVVTKEDKQLAEVQLKKQNSLLDLMLNNYIEIKKLYYIQKKLELHQQLGQVHFQFIRYHPQFQNQFVSLPQMKKIYDFQADFPSFIKEEMIDSLMSDVLTLYEQLNNIQENEQNYERSFSELLMKQQHLIAHLNQQCEQRVNQLNILKQKILSNHKEQPYQSSQFNSTIRSNNHQNNNMEQSRYDQNSNRYSPKVTKEEVRQLSPVQEQQYNQNILYNKSLQSTSKIIKNNSESTKRQKSLNRSNSPNRIIPTPQSQDGLSQNDKKSYYQSNNSRQNNTITQSDIGLNSTKKKNDNNTNNSTKNYQSPTSKQSILKNNNNADCCRRFMNNQDEEALDQFKRSQSSRSPYRQTNQELKDIVDDLSTVVLKKEDEVEQLRSINQKIIDDNEEKERENNELYDLAQKQMQTLHERQQTEINIESEIHELRQQINSLMSKNIDLEKVQQEKQDLEQQIQLKQQQIEEQDYFNYIEEKAEQYNYIRMKKLLFNSLKQACQIENKINQFKINQNNINSYNIQENYFKAWFRLVLIKKYAQHEYQQKQLSLQKKTLKLWQSNIKFQQNLAILQQKRNKKALKRTMICWKQHQRIQNICNSKKEKINKYYNKKLIIKSMKSLKSNMLQNKINPLKERRLIDQASTFYSKKLKNRIFNSWINYQYEVVIPRNQKINHIQKTLKFLQMSRIFRIFQNNRIENQSNMLKARQYDQFQKKRYKNLIFKRWKAMYQNNKYQKNEFQQLLKYTTLKRTFKNWRDALLENKYNKKMTLKCINHQKKQIQQKYFNNIKQYYKNKIEERKKSLQIQKLQQFNFYKLCLVSWIDRMKPMIKSKELKMKITQRITKNCFNIIKNNARQQKKQKINDYNLEMFLIEKTKKSIKSTFDSFKKYVQKKSHQQKLIINQQQNRKYKLYRIFINNILKENNIKLKQIIYQMNNQLKLNETNIFSNQDIIRQYENEKQDLLNEINQIKEDNFGQKLLIEEYQQNQIKYNSAMRSIERQEKIFKEDRDSYEVKIKDYEELLKQIHQEYQNQITQKDYEIHNIQNENRAVQKQLSILQKEIEYTEKALLNRGEQSTIMLRDTEKKLQNSILMANEFKNKIQEQENDLDDLKNQIYSRDLDIEQLKLKLKESIDLIRETSQMYDNKINDFNAIIENKNNQIQEFIDKQIRFQSQTNELKAELRKQHLEIELFSEMQPMLDQHPDVNRYYQEQLELQNELDAQRNSLKKRMDKLNKSLNKIHDMDRIMAQQQQNAREHNYSQDRINVPHPFSGHGSPISDREQREYQQREYIRKYSGIINQNYIEEQQQQQYYDEEKQQIQEQLLQQQEMKGMLSNLGNNTFSNYNNEMNQTYATQQNEEYNNNNYLNNQNRLHTEPSNYNNYNIKYHSNVQQNYNKNNNNNLFHHYHTQSDDIMSTDLIAAELEANRANRRLFKENIEKRISRLDNNIGRDLAHNERNKSRSQSPLQNISSL